MTGRAAMSGVLRGSPLRGERLSMKRISTCKTTLHPEAFRAAEPRRMGRESPIYVGGDHGAAP
jgi:hypothetical protein